MRVIDINIDSPNDLYRGIYITKYNGICINGMKYVLNGKLLYVMLYFFKRIYSIKLYISVEVNNIFMCSQMLSFTGNIKEKIILGKIS